MEAVVVDAGSKLLKAGIAAPDQLPPLVMPSKMKLEVEDQQLADGAVMEEVVQPVVRGFVKDWDAMEDLLNYVLYRNIGWEIGDEGQILFTEPLFTPKAFMPLNRLYCHSMLLDAFQDVQLTLGMGK